MNKPAALVAALLLSATAFAEDPAAPNLTDAQIAELLEGEVITNVERDGDNNRAELICIIDGAPADVWEVVMDYGSYEDWFPDQLEAEVREDNGDSHVLYGETRVPILRNRVYELRDQASTRTVDGETHYVDTWEYIPDSGNMESTTGFWYVHPFEGGKTMVRMVVHANLGMWVPQGIINWGTRRMLPGIAEGIQEQVDAR